MMASIKLNPSSALPPPPVSFLAIPPSPSARPLAESLAGPPSQMLERIAGQVKWDEWKQQLNWNNLNTLCWAIGSISGSMAEDQVGGEGGRGG